MGRRRRPAQRHEISIKNEINRIIGRIQSHINKKSYVCMYPNYNSLEIQSHSQQKEGQLRAIAKKGKVYTLVIDQYKAFKIDSSESLPRLKKVGISEASAFQGFCSDHDREIFKEIDTKVLDNSNEKQSFLLFLRALCY